MQRSNAERAVDLVWPALLDRPRPVPAAAIEDCLTRAAAMLPRPLTRDEYQWAVRELVERLKADEEDE